MLELIEPIGLDPAADADLAAELFDLQRAAYAVEARLISSDRIPPLRETLGELQAASLRWIGCRADQADGRAPLLGALAWSMDPGGAERDIDRLVVSPAAFRRGIGRLLVTALLARAPAGTAVRVSTGRDNAPARRLYESLGFAPVADVEVEPGLWISSYRRLACPGAR